MPRWIQHPETLELIPAHLYERPSEKSHYIQGEIEPYESPVDGKVIYSRRQHKEDLKRTGCRHWEGREVEERVARRNIAEAEERLTQRMTETFIDRLRHSSAELQRAFRD